MTQAEVQALYPVEPDRVKHGKNSITLKGFVEIGKCRPDVDIYFKDGKVRDVVTGMVPRGLRAMCNEDAYLAMMSKYGKPDAELNRDDKTFSGQPYQAMTYTWIKDGVSIVMNRDVGSPYETWNVTYSPIAAKAVKGL